MSSKCPIRSPQYTMVRELSKTSYDSWVLPPALEDFEHIIDWEPKNYSNINIEELSRFVLSNMKTKEDLINHMSPECLKKLEGAIRSSYSRLNWADVNEGGDGLLIPSFVQIMHEFIFWIRDGKLVLLKNSADKEFYAKYFWTFDLMARLNFQYIHPLFKKSA